jgi:hypothetical protein
MARVAGLLAVAVLGVFAYGAFSAPLDARLDSMELPGEVLSALEAAKGDLGAAEAPEDVDAGLAVRIEDAIDESFVAGFRAVMLVSAGLALASALAAALLVGDGRVRGPRADIHSIGQSLPGKGNIMTCIPRRGSGAREKGYTTCNRQPELIKGGKRCTSRMR